MPINNNPILDALAVFVQAIGRDWKLRQWFYGLTQKTLVERRHEIYSTADLMMEQGEETKIVASMRMLADSKVFDAVHQALREHGHIPD